MMATDKGALGAARREYRDHTPADDENENGG
jgi:hypothetical protein